MKKVSTTAARRRLRRRDCSKLAPGYTKRLKNVVRGKKAGN